MHLPNVTVHIHGCQTCGDTTPCGCSNQGSLGAQTLPNVQTPCNDTGNGCEEIVKTTCTLWDGPDIPEYGIKNGDSLTKVVTILLGELTNLKNA
jgi:hypothetical protein